MQPMDCYKQVRSVSVCGLCVQRVWSVCRYVADAEVEEVGLTAAAVTQRSLRPATDIPLQAQSEDRYVTTLMYDLTVLSSHEGRRARHVSCTVDCQNNKKARHCKRIMHLPMQA